MARTEPIWNKEFEQHMSLFWHQQGKNIFTSSQVSEAACDVVVLHVLLRSLDSAVDVLEWDVEEKWWFLFSFCVVVYYPFCSVGKKMLKVIIESCSPSQFFCWSHRGVLSPGGVVQFFIVKEVVQVVFFLYVREVVLAVAKVAVEGLEPTPRWEVAFIAETQVPPKKLHFYCQYDFATRLLTQLTFPPYEWSILPSSSILGAKCAWKFYNHCYSHTVVL